MHPDLPLDQILIGDCRELLKTLPDGSVHCVVTSPPYWGLRSYGTTPQIWTNGHEPCAEHQWGDTSYQRRSNDNGKTAKQLSNYGANRRDEPVKNDTCSLCGAWRGELGLEPTPELYVEHLTQIFREVKRVLRDDGTLWLNFGDSYVGGKGANNHRWSVNHLDRETLEQEHHHLMIETGRPCDNMQNMKQSNLKPKDLVGIPWMVAFALRADGWYLRSDIIWAKPNPMPESVTDRPTKAHEYIFLLSKSQRYYYDADAVAEPANYDGRKDEMMHGGEKYNAPVVPGQTAHTMAVRGHARWNKDEDGNRVRNRRTIWTVDDERALLEWLTENYPDTAQEFFSMQHERKDVWQIATHPFKGAHFATFPPKLIEPCILAGCPVGGVVLDPFMGSGTTASVCISLKRHYIGFDLNPAYVEGIAQDRADNTPPPLFVL